MPQATPFEQFQQFLREMFQYDHNDLDFGLFKVLRLKRKYIEQFIAGDGEQDLKAIVGRELAAIRSQDSEDERDMLGRYLDDLGRKTREAWADLQAEPNDAARQARLKQAIEALEEPERLAATRQRLERWLLTQKYSIGHLEAQLYNYLLNFFELYYQNGDFGYNSRASHAFKVPYEADYDGRDTLFHWKHKDSYYIKTGASFPEVKVEVLGRKIVFRLQAGGEAETTAQNNNKDSDIKQYRLAGIARDEGENAWVARFTLAKTGTPKADIYRRLWQAAFAGQDDLPEYIAAYLFEGDEESKPLFNDLGRDHDKAEGGQIKGINQLRLGEDKYRETLARHAAFRHLGGNAEKRAEALKNDPAAQALHALDRALNRFYVGQDADYFIHKDLHGFLSREKDRFIKNVLFSDLDTLLDRQVEPATLILARGFNAVASRIIEFLDVLETFQRNLFTLKKKVVDTHWLISAGRIDAAHYPRLLAQAPLLDYWAREFHCQVATLEDLAAHPSLVVDTSLLPGDEGRQLVADILGGIDHLDEQTDGLLLHSENWQALNLLREKFRERIQCIYIDPPYNTGGDGFLYKDSFRHSSWASMLEDRLALAKDLLGPAGVLFASIDDKERAQLEQMLIETFGAENRVEELIWAQNTTKNQSPTYSTNHEYIQVYARNLEIAQRDENMFREPKPGYTEVIELVERLNPDYPPIAKIEAAIKALFEEHKAALTAELEEMELEYEKNLDPWKGLYNYTHAEYRDAQGKLVAEGEAARYEATIRVWREDNPSAPAGKQSPTTKDPDDLNYRFYKPTHPVTCKPCKHPKRGWGWPFRPDPNDPGRPSFQALDEDHRIVWGADANKIPQMKKFLHEVDTQVAKSVVLDYTDGEKELTNLTGQPNSFPNPKPTTLISRFIEQTTQPGDWVLDFFVGSGTTGHAVLKLDEKRRFLLTEMGGHFDTVLKPRLARVMYSPLWKAGQPGAASRRRYLVKVQRLEQYEDVLANLTAVWDEASLPEDVPVQYLFRPEQNRLQLSLDLRRPFANRLRAGPLLEERPLDLLESWAYLQGYWQRSRRVFQEGGRRYACLETECGALVILRDIEEPEDDSAAIATIVARYAEPSEEGTSVPRLRRLELNHWANLVSLEQALSGLPCTLIQPQDFDRGAEWV